MMMTVLDIVTQYADQIWGIYLSSLTPKIIQQTTKFKRVKWPNHAPIRGNLSSCAQYFPWLISVPTWTLKCLASTTPNLW